VFTNNLLLYFFGELKRTFDALGCQDVGVSSQLCSAVLADQHVGVIVRPANGTDFEIDGIVVSHSTAFQG